MPIGARALTRHNPMTSRRTIPLSTSAVLGIDQLYTKGSPKSAIEDAMKFATVSLDSIERMFALNLEAVKVSLDVTAKKAKAVGAVKEAQELNGLTTKASETGIEFMTGYSKNLYEISSAAQAKFSALVEERIASFQKSVVEGLDKASKSALPSSDVAYAAIKSSMAASTAAMDTLTKAGKQLSTYSESARKTTGENVFKATPLKRRGATRSSDDAPKIAAVRDKVLWDVSVGGQSTTLCVDTEYSPIQRFEQQSEAFAHQSAVAPVAPAERSSGSTVMDDAYLPEVVRSGLPFACAENVSAWLDISTAQLYELIGLPVRTAQRRKQEMTLTSAEADRLTRVARIVADAIRVFGNIDTARRWLNREHVILGGVAPIKILDTDSGAEQVADELTRIEFGELVA